MIRLRHTHNAASCWQYFLNDKALSAEERQGIWIGKGAEKLGWQLGDVVSHDGFARLLDGYTKDGESCVMVRRPRRRSAYDVVVSVPKSVSLAALTWQDDKGRAGLRKCFLEACRAFSDALDSLAMQQGPRHVRKPTGNVAGALFIHHWSRYSDPHLHAHFVLGNMTRTKLGWRAVAADAFFAAKVALDSIFMHGLYGYLCREGFDARMENNLCVLPIAKEIERAYCRGRDSIESAMKGIEGSPKRLESLRMVVNDRLHGKWHRRIASPIGSVESKYPHAFAKCRSSKQGHRTREDGSAWTLTLRRELVKVGVGEGAERVKAVAAALSNAKHPFVIAEAAAVARGWRPGAAPLGDTRSVRRKSDICRFSQESHGERIQETNGVGA